MVSKHSGVSLSVLAQKTAPPQAKSYKWFIGLIVFGAIALNQKEWIMGAIFLLAGLGGGYYVYDFNNNKYPDIFTQWKRKWVCLKCGQDFSE